ncbi:bifunctional diguanylate cyclase/phosphodiesterase [Psychromonas sp. L1A2]|uniref:bifunctional diguanylate cyclase/phosphodiesterase n=1 Tax=Psychromonas sp. L1A2 TaxID=2686356 RepID=UPI0013582977|nr:bifunctional diguanylate cyclase/phosphodiesterase [Psychromonas sp. L1A2]
MNKLRQTSLIVLLPSVLFIVFIILQGSVFLLDYDKKQHQLYIESEQDIKGLAGQLQTSLSNSLMRLEKARAQDFVSTAALNENVKTVAVVDNNQQVVLSNNFREKYMFAKLQLERYEGQLLDRVINQNEIVVKYFKDSKELVVYAPLQMISKGNSLNRKFNGVIFIRYSLTSAYSELMHDSLFMLINFSLILLVTMALFVYFINRSLVLPLKRLAQSVNITDITNQPKIQQSGLGEVGLLQRAFANLISDVSNNINQLAASEERWLYAINAARDGVWDWDVAAGQVYYSNQWKEMLGYQQESISNDILEWESRIHLDDVFQVTDALGSHFSGRTSFFESTHRIKCNNEEYLWVLSRGQTVSWDTEGNPLRVIGTVTDVSSYKKSHEQAKTEAQLDKITELPNQVQLVSYISKEIIRLQNKKLQGALITLDCEQFKLAGQYQSDELLYLIARRLERNKLSPDFVCHKQDAVFVIVLPDLHVCQEQTAELALTFTKKLDVALTAPFEIHNKELTLSFVFGITLFPVEDIQPDELLEQSSKAMKTENSQFGNISFYSKNIGEKLHLKHSLRTKIQKGLENEEFSLFFQQRVDTDGHLVGVEALCHWQHGQQGWIDSTDFLPVAEESGLIIPLGDWVIRHAFLELQGWIKQGLPTYFKTLSMNVSPKQLLQQEFIASLEKYLLETGIDANLIELEITETVLVSHTELVINKLNELRKLGFKFAIDDFGTGYSSFSYLSVLPVSTLKIDQSFIINLLQQENQQVIVSAIINMGKSLNLDIVAEGIENVDELDFLINKGCNQFQGAFIGEPLSAYDFQHILLNETVKPKS